MCLWKRRRRSPRTLLTLLNWIFVLYVSRLVHQPQIPIKELESESQYYGIFSISIEFTNINVELRTSLETGRTTIIYFLLSSWHIPYRTDSVAHAITHFSLTDDKTIFLFILNLWVHYSLCWSCTAWIKVFNITALLSPVKLLRAISAAKKSCKVQSFGVLT